MTISICNDVSVVGGGDIPLPQRPGQWTGSLCRESAREVSPGIRSRFPRSPIVHPLASSVVPTSRLPNDAVDELPRELVELGKRIAALPPQYQESLDTCYTQVVDSVRRRRRILTLVQDALSQLRLDIKYLMFDLDVTRKERDVFQERLEGGTEA
jgi:hypothetical protein